MSLLSTHMAFALLVLLFLPTFIILAYALWECWERAADLSDRILRLERQVDTLTDRLHKDGLAEFLFRKIENE